MKNFVNNNIFCYDNVECRIGALSMRGLLVQF